MSSNDTVSNSQTSDMSYSLPLSQETMNILAGAVGLTNTSGDRLHEEYHVDHDEEDDESDGLPGSSSISISRAVFLVNNSQSSSDGSSSSQGLVMVPSTPPSNNYTPSITPPTSMTYTPSSSSWISHYTNDNGLSPTLIQSPSPPPAHLTHTPLQTSPLHHPPPPPLSLIPSQSSSSQHSHIPQNVPLPGPYEFYLLLDSNLLPSSKRPNIIWSSDIRRMYIKKDAKVPLTFTTNGPLPANTVLNAMAIHKLPEMISENLKCCVKHVDEMKRNGVLHPFHFIQSTMDNCCYYGDPKLRRLFISLPVASLQKAGGDREYTALYQFPCFTSDFKRAGQLVQIIFTLECEGNVIGRAVLDVRVCASPGRDHTVDEKKMKKKTTIPPVVCEEEEGEREEERDDDDESLVGRRRKGKKRATSVREEVHQCTFPPKRLCHTPSQRVPVTVETFPEMIPHLKEFIKLLERVYMIRPDISQTTRQQPPSLVHQDSFPSLERWLNNMSLSKYLQLFHSQGVKDTFQAMSLTGDELKTWGISENDTRTIINGLTSLQEGTSITPSSSYLPSHMIPSSSQTLSQTSNATQPFASFEVVQIQTRRQLPPLLP